MRLFHAIALVGVSTVCHGAKLERFNESCAYICSGSKLARWLEGSQFVLGLVHTDPQLVRGFTRGKDHQELLCTTKLQEDLVGISPRYRVSLR